MRSNSRYKLRELAKGMRQRPTRGERALWEVLRNRGVHGLKFRRQAILGGFIVDFYCPALRVAIEVDGPVHNTETIRGRDPDRDRILRTLGVRVFHLQDDAALGEAAKALLSDLLLRPPSPYHGEGDRG